MVTAVWTAGSLILFLLVWRFVFNSGGGYYRSGYGYDALEYLVIGRSLNDGMPFYTFIPSKSWALYALVAGYLRIPMAGTHFGVSLLVTTVLAISGGITFVVMRRPFGSRAAAIATAFVLLAGLFMELNYLEAEGFVFLATLLAFRTLAARPAPPGVFAFFVAGAWIGVGVAFKSVAALAAIGVIVWTLGSVGAPRKIAALIAGLISAIAIPAAYFWLTGRLTPHVQWSVVFPLWHYPTNTEWAEKLVTKLSWVWVVIAFGVVMSRVVPARDRFTRTSSTGLLACMGLVSLLPLLKTQASHYAFPGGALLLCFSAVAIDQWMRSVHMTRGFRVLLAATGLASVVLVGLIYRPEALAAITRTQNYDQEQSLKTAIGQLVPPDRRAIFLTRGTSLYWVTERYPPWPILNMDVQTTYTIGRQGGDLLKALDDPRLALVEFDPKAVVIGDAQLAASEGGRRFLTDFECRLVADFDRRDDLVPSLVLWLRKG